MWAQLANFSYSQGHHSGQITLHSLHCCMPVTIFSLFRYGLCHEDTHDTGDLNGSPNVLPSKASGERKVLQIIPTGIISNSSLGLGCQVLPREGCNMLPYVADIKTSPKLLPPFNLRKLLLSLQPHLLPPCPCNHKAFLVCW